MGMHGAELGFAVQVLQQTHGAMELVDVSADLAALKRCPGRTAWEVKDKTGWHAAYDEGINKVSFG